MEEKNYLAFRFDNKNLSIYGGGRTIKEALKDSAKYKDNKEIYKAGYLHVEEIDSIYKYYKKAIELWSICKEKGCICIDRDSWLCTLKSLKEERTFYEEFKNSSQYKDDDIFLIGEYIIGAKPLENVNDLVYELFF